MNESLNDFGLPESEDFILDQNEEIIDKEALESRFLQTFGVEAFGQNIFTKDQFEKIAALFFDHRKMRWLY